MEETRFDEDPAIQFRYFDHWEKKQEGTTYTLGPFVKDFGHGPRTYCWEFYSERATGTPYAVAREKYSKEELRALDDYCMCPAHLLPGLCSCCCGCVATGNPYRVGPARWRRQRWLSRQYFFLACGATFLFGMSAIFYFANKLF